MTCAPDATSRSVRNAASGLRRAATVLASTASLYAIRFSRQQAKRPGCDQDERATRQAPSTVVEVHGVRQAVETTERFRGGHRRYAAHVTASGVMPQPVFR